MSTHPAPEPIVVAVQQPQERAAPAAGRRRPPTGEVAFQQLVEFAHSAPATPAQAAQLGRFGVGHPRSNPTASTAHRAHNATPPARYALKRCMTLLYVQWMTLCSTRKA